MKSSNFKYSILAASLLLVVSFQNCAKTSFGYDESSLVSKKGLFSIQDALLHTELNTPVEFTIVREGSSSGLSLSASDGGSVTTASVANGFLSIIDANSYKAKFTPTFGYRGKSEFKIYAVDKYGQSVSALVTVFVANPIGFLQPSMATRGLGCVSCHLKMSSNLITDFGFGGDGGSRDYFFGGRGGSSDFFQYATGHAWNSASPYGDSGNSIASIRFNNAEAKVLVPNAMLPSFTGLNKSVATYMKDQLQSEAIFPKDAVTKNITVQAKSEIYIGAPTVTDIMQSFSLSVGQFKYFKNEPSSAALSGLVNTAGVYRNQGTLTCDGDLAIDGTVYLENLQLNTKNGCRIYSTGSVLIYGAINYVNKVTTSNLQISSAHAVYIGLGSVMNAANSDTCETTGWYKDLITTDRNTFMGGYTSSFKHRLKTVGYLPYTFYRENKTPTQIGDALMAELANVESRLGIQLKDASCRAETRAVHFERLLINAQQIHSRYTGDFNGSLIGENILMSLSQFSFKYDEVFSAVPVLPMLKSSIYLEVK